MAFDFFYPYEKNLRMIYMTIICSFVVILSVLWYTQIIQGEKYTNLSSNNRIRRVVVSAPRGLIFDRNGILLVDNRPSFDVELIPDEVKDLKMTAETLGKILGETKKNIVKKTKLGGYIPYLPVIVARDVGIDKITVLEEQKPFISGINVQVRAIRNYIYNDYASHLIGHVGSITLEEYKKLKDKGYMPQDTIGKGGVEKALDAELIGVSGGMQIQVNSKGVKDRVLSSKNPIRGSDVYLTIDKRLQDVLESELANNSGAIVAMDPKNGQILAYVSKPGFDPNIFIRSRAAMELGKVLKDHRRPLVDRVISGIYAPGSIFKIVVALAALETRTINAAARHYCPGSFFLGQKRFNCWRERGHGTLDVTDALKYSCNVFFYRTGMMLGSSAISDYAKKFLFGEKTGIVLSPEKRGVVPDSEWKKKTIRSPWVGGDTVNFSIGQGYMLVTPIQIASMMAAVANGGTIYKPLLIEKVKSPLGDETVFPPVVKGVVNISKSSADTVKKGLYKVVNDKDGTGHNAFLPDEGICGKTGTVQYGPSGNEKTHAWFAGFAPYNDPAICVAIIVESAGSGGLSAAPIAKKVFERYFEINKGEKTEPPLLNPLPQGERKRIRTVPSPLMGEG